MKKKKQRSPKPTNPPGGTRAETSVLSKRFTAALRSPAATAASIVLVSGTVAVWFAFAVVAYGPPTARAAVQPPMASTQPALTTQRRHLDGVMVNARQANSWPMGVMIENTRAARPQSGLSLAKVVFEAPAEAGVLRLLAIFDGSEGDDAIGPVRSARHYFVDWALGFDAMYVHAGGSPQAVALMLREKDQSANGIGSMSRFFHREATRPAPHNLYTSLSRLRDIRRVKSLETRTSSFTPWTFADDAPLASRATPRATVVDFGGAAYRVEWRYDQQQNRYVRWMDGAVHADAANGQALQAANVVVLRVGPVTSLGEKGRIDFPTVGSGPMTLLHNGTVETGTWRKESSRGMLEFLGADGTLSLTAGPTWVEALPLDRPFTP